MPSLFKVFQLNMFRYLLRFWKRSSIQEGIIKGVHDQCRYTDFFEESFARRFGVIVIRIYESVQRRSNPIVKFPQSSDAVYIPLDQTKAAGHRIFVSQNFSAD